MRDVANDEAGFAHAVEELLFFAAVIERFIEATDALEANTDWLEKLLLPLLSGDADCTGGPDVVPVHDPLITRCVGYSVDSPLTTAGLLCSGSL